MVSKKCLLPRFRRTIFRWVSPSDTLLDAGMTSRIYILDQRIIANDGDALCWKGSHADCL